MARYHEIANDIRTQITNGLYKKEEKLPKQIELANLYQTSRVTIQKALDLLQIEGIIYGKKGVGTFVSGPLSVYDYNVQKNKGLTKKLGDLGILTSKIISFEVLFPHEKEQEKLKIQKNDPIYDIVRLRLLDDEPLALEYTTMPVYLIPGITEEVLEGSIYQYITENLGLQMGPSTRRIKADKSDRYDQKYLECAVDDPVLEVEQVYYLQNGIPFEFSQTRHRYDKGDFTIINHE